MGDGYVESKFQYMGNTNLSYYLNGYGKTHILGFGIPEQLIDCGGGVNTIQVSITSIQSNKLALFDFILGSFTYNNSIDLSLSHQFLFLMLQLQGFLVKQNNRRCTQSEGKQSYITEISQCNFVNLIPAMLSAVCRTKGGCWCNSV